MSGGGGSSNSGGSGDNSSAAMVQASVQLQPTTQQQQSYHEDLPDVRRPQQGNGGPAPRNGINEALEQDAQRRSYPEGQGSNGYAGVREQPAPYSSSSSAASAPSLAAKGLLFRTPTSSASRQRIPARSQTFSEGSYRQGPYPAGPSGSRGDAGEGETGSGSSVSPAGMQPHHPSYPMMRQDHASPYDTNGSTPPLHGGPSPSNARPSPSAIGPSPMSLDGTVAMSEGHTPDTMHERQHHSGMAQHRGSEDWGRHHSESDDRRPPYPVPGGPGWNNDMMMMMDQDTHGQRAGQDKGGVLIRKVSCLECRASKVKCSGQSADGDGACVRCRRGNRECIWQKHKRGRKPAEHLRFHKLEEKFEQISKEIETFRRRQAEGGLPEDPNMQMAGWPMQTSSTAPLPMQGGSFDSMLNADSLPASARLAAFGNAAAKDSWNAQLISSANTPAQEHYNVLSSRATSSNASDGSAAPLQSFLAKADEPTNLGLPALSNPLKLLAQASGTAREPPDGSAATLGQDVDMDATRTAAGRLLTSMPLRRGLGIGQRDYFAHGIYTSRLDIEPRFDPVELGHLTIDRAQELYELFLARLNPNITLLDPTLHTFEYVRSHSASLLTSCCALAARFSKAAGAADQVRLLDQHMRSVLLPAILLEGFRSVEIAQAFVILAAYHPPTKTLMEDRSYGLLGYGIRIAAELDMNSRMVSSVADPDDEVLQRKLRNRERTYLNLWLFEQSLATHMGRRPTLTNDPVILASPRWHLSRFAIPEDEAIVAVVQLRRIMARHLESFEALKLGGSASDVLGYFASPASAPSSAPAYDALRDIQLDFYRRTCNSDINAWAATWCVADSPPTSGPSPRDPTHATQRLAKGPLYAHYARIILLSAPIRTSAQQPSSALARSAQIEAVRLEPFYREIYASTVSYLCAFLEKLVPRDMVADGNNSTCVTVVYVAVFALKLVSGSVGGARSPEYVDADLVLGLVAHLVRVLEDAGQVTPHRDGTAGSYAPYLAAILARAQHERRPTGLPATNSGDTNDAAASEGTSLNDAPTLAPAPALSSGLGALQFHAGPSGVQTSELDFDEYTVSLSGGNAGNSGDGDGEPAADRSGATGTDAPGAAGTEAPAGPAKTLAESLGLTIGIGSGLRDSFFEDLSDVGLPPSAES